MPTHLCGSHVAFYACLHRSDRKLGPVYPTSSQPRQPYICLADSETFCNCPHADTHGRKHLAAGIMVKGVHYVPES